MRTFDASRVIDIAYRPHVAALVGLGGTPEIQTVVDDPNNFLLEGPHGGVIYINRTDVVWEAHSIFDPKEEKSFSAVIEFAKYTLEYMFTQTACKRVVTMVPESNPAARMLAIKCGFTKWTSSLYKHTDGSSIVVYSLELDKWASTCLAMRHAGHMFHEWLEGHKKLKGSELVTHEDDPVHDHYAGAAITMFKAGLAEKAIALYNMWAFYAGYQMTTLVSQHPDTIDIGDAIIGLRGGELEMVQCR